jgi:hypothetical protein
MDWVRSIMQQGPVTGAAVTAAAAFKSLALVTQWLYTVTVHCRLLLDAP